MIRYDVTVTCGWLCTQAVMANENEKAGVIQRADVAAFCLRMLKEDTYVRKAVGITGS